MSIPVNKVTDSDGRIKSTYEDHFGRTLATSNGADAPTYYLYDLYDRLRAVKNSGIAVTDTLNMWRYDYDDLGRLSSKGIPGSVREYYTYDDEDRVIAILRDGVLKEMEYDAMNRVVKVWQTRPEGNRTLLEEYTYDVYPTGVTGSNPKGKKTSSRIAVVGPDSDVTGYTRITWSYDDKGRPVLVRTMYPDGSEQTEELEYTFIGDVASSVNTYTCGGQSYELSLDNTYDTRGRFTKETVTLNVSGESPQFAEVLYEYDTLGRLAHEHSSMSGGKLLHTTSAYSLQGWQTGVSVTMDGRQLFNQTLGYDCQENMPSYQPQYSGLISIKDEVWFPASGTAVNDAEWYTYDYAGRLNAGYTSSSSSTYGYDARGNLLYERCGEESASYKYSGDRLDTLTFGNNALSYFIHDTLGRMTFDGTTGQSMTYNDLDLIGNVTRNDTTLVNYSYLADGTKLSALAGDGEGLVYRGPFVYRTSDGGSSLTLESASFGGGRLTPDGALLYVKDYLGSVRAVVNGATGDLYKVSDYSSFGEESGVPSMQTVAVPDDLTLRDSYTGKEAQHPDFGTGYTDFGARQYNPALCRWMTPDPLSEKYYGISPYAFCNNNPVNFVDPDGRFPDIIWDIASIGVGVHNFVENIRSGNVRGAAGDALGIAVDAVAAAVPFVPGGVGAVRVGAKAVNAIDNAADAAKSVKSVGKADDASSTIRVTENSLGKTKSSKTGGENAATKLGREKHKEYNPGDDYIKEFRLPSGKRADAVSFEKGDVRELKPNNSKAIRRGEKQVQVYRDELQKMHPEVEWECHIDVYNK